MFINDFYKCRCPSNITLYSMLMKVSMNSLR